MQRKPNPWPVAPNGKPARRVKAETGIYWSVSGRLEVCFTDSDGRVRFEPQESPNISAARTRRRAILNAKDNGAAVRATPRLRFGEVRERWLDVEVSAKPAAQTRTTLAYHAGKLPWAETRMDRIDSGEVARVLRDLRARGHADSTVAKVKAAADAIFKFARREMRWAGTNPVADLPRAHRTAAPEYLLHTEAALAATIAAAGAAWKAPLRFIADTGLRESEALAVLWRELHLEDDVPYVEVTHQLTRSTRAQPAVRAPLKTEHSRGVVPLTRDAVRLLKAHKLRSRHTGPDDFVFSTVNGTPVSQRNLLRALDTAQRKALSEDGQPIYPAATYIGADGKLVLRRRGDGKLVSRKAAGLPHIHGMRHSLATRIIEDGHRTEDATAILRHKDSEVTRRTYVHAIHSAEQHARLGDLLEKMSSGMARTDGDTAAQPQVAEAADVAYLSETRESA